MHQLTEIALCALVFICGTLGEDNNDDDLPAVTMEVLSSGDSTTGDDISVDRTNISSKVAADTSGNVSESPFTSSTDDVDLDLSWLNEAIRDVAYYLRAYKFNEFDRRYNPHNQKEPGNYFALFPKPPLRSLHWEVRKYCEPSFLSCIEFLNKRVKFTSLRRSDDTSVIIAEQNWYSSNFTEQIDAVEAECKKMKKRDDILARPFQGPIERFQWRTTASYYMCWYAMHSPSDFKKLGEPCDNFASCLDSKFGPRNKDVRASDDEPFGCILYSVCPDPCCPLRHISAFSECWDNAANPCFQGNPAGQRRCVLKREQNTDFTDIVLNRWNVSCACTKSGYTWDSRYGTCVDINECATAAHNCSEPSEVCVNLPGGHRCACNWGYIWDAKLERCVTSPALSVIKRHHQNPQKTQPSTTKSLIRIIIKKIKKLFNKSEFEEEASSGARNIKYGQYMLITITLLAFGMK